MAVVLILVCGIAAGLLFAYALSTDRRSEQDQMRAAEPRAKRAAELRAKRAAQVIIQEARQTRQAMAALARRYEREERRR